MEGSSDRIRNIAVYANNNAGIRIDDGSTTISNTLLGVNAAGANAGNIDYGVEVTDGAVTVDGNYFSTNTDAGIYIDGGTSSLIQNNHITTNGSGPCDDNIQLISGTGITIRQNLIEAAASLGVEGEGFSGGVLITENSITTSGQDGTACSGDIENAGIRLHGDNSSITNNLIFSNGGPGIVLAGGNTSGNLISQNSIYANGTTADALGIDIDNSNGIGDGVTLNENGDTDNGPNGSLNFPIITSAYVSGNTVVLKGWTRPGTTVEFFLTDINEGTATLGDNELGLSTDYGEGQTYLGSAVEGSGSDADGGSSSYTDLDGNTDTTNQFEFSIPMPPGTSVGEHITATATLSNSTSEFSPFSIIKVRTVITNRRITYRVNPN
jgi:parallel beta-helix repeat protein